MPASNTDHDTYIEVPPSTFTKESVHKMIADVHRGRRAAKELPIPRLRVLQKKP